MLERNYSNFEKWSFYYSLFDAREKRQHDKLGTITKQDSKAELHFVNYVLNFFDR